MPTLPDPITIILIYLCGGSLTWMLLYSLGVIDAGLSSRARRLGRPPSPAAILLGVIAVMLFWPRFVPMFWKRWMRR